MINLNSHGSIRPVEDLLVDYIDRFGPRINQLRHIVL